MSDAKQQNEPLEQGGSSGSGGSGIAAGALDALQYRRGTAKLAVRFAFLMLLGNVGGAWYVVVNSLNAVRISDNNGSQNKQEFVVSRKKPDVPDDSDDNDTFDGSGSSDTSQAKFNMEVTTPNGVITLIGVMVSGSFLFLFGIISKLERLMMTDDLIVRCTKNGEAATLTPLSELAKSVSSVVDGG